MIYGNKKKTFEKKSYAEVHLPLEYKFVQDH